jgi:hypothetical protein
MGAIDQTTVQLTCDKCEATDAVTALQKGSVYNFRPWGDFSASSKFEIETQPGIDGPDVTGSTCKVCGSSARVDENAAANTAVR